MGEGPNAVRLRSALAVLLTIALAVACSSERAPEKIVAREPSPEIDLTATIPGAAFRAEGARLAGGGLDYASQVEGQHLRVTPRGLGQGLDLATVSPAASGEARVDDRGDAVIPRGLVRERLHNEAGGVEQSWEVPSLPDGELVIRVRTSGLPLVRSSTTGHHFADRTAGRGVRYGLATWVDAQGTRTPIPVERAGNDLVMTVPRAVLARSSYPAVLDPVIGPELGTDPPLSSAPGLGYRAVLAPGPNGEYLATWEGPGNIRLRRYSAAMLPLGTEQTVPLSSTPCVAFDPTSSTWIVGGGTATGTGAVRVDATGTPLDATPIALGTTNGTCAASFDGTRFAVAVAGTGTRLYYVDKNGAVLAPSPVVLEAASTGLRTAVACTPAQCLVAYMVTGSLYTRRVDASGVLQGTADYAGSPDGSHSMAVVTDGSQFLVTWSSFSSVYAKRYSAAGVAANVALGSPVITTPNLFDFHAVAAAFDGQRFVIARGGAADLAIRRVATDGSLFDAAQVLVSAGPYFSPSLAFNADKAVVGWASHSSVFGSRLSSTLTLLDGVEGVPLARTTNAQALPRAAFNGSSWLVVWVDARTPRPDVYGLRLSSTGTPLSATATSIARDVGGVDIATNGTDFLVTYVRSAEGGRRVEAVRVSGSTGAVLDATPLVLPGISYARPAVTYDGQSYVVAWSDVGDDTLTNGDILAGRVSPAGAVLDAKPIRVATTTYEESVPYIASDGTASFVVWQKWPNTFEGDVYGARISRAGVVLEPGGFPVADASYGQADPAVAWTGSEYVVTWADERLLSQTDLYAARVDSAGKLLDGSGVLARSEIANGYAPALASTGDGSTLYVAWREVQAGTPHIVGARLRRPGLELVDTPVDLVANPATVPRWALATGAPGTTLFMFHRTEPALGVSRVYLRLVDVGKVLGTACADGAECGSALCRDGVCCDAKCDGVCETCAGSGKCAAVKSAPDPGTCEGTQACSADGARACKRANGQVCSLASDCASGFCVDGFCCDTACDGACATCSETRGKCTPVTIGDVGEPSCAPYRCDGALLVCPASCKDDVTCADGHGCDRELGQCIAGTVCSDSRTARAPNGVRSDCAPYACKSRACLTECRGVTDCAYPAVCDASGRCVNDPGTGLVSGCSATRPVPLSEHGWRALLAAMLVLAARRRRRR